MGEKVMDDIQKYSTIDELNIMLKEDNRIKEYANNVQFGKMTAVDAWCETFNLAKPLNPSMQTKMYRWIKKDVVQKWIRKVNKGLEVDFFSDKMAILERQKLIALDELFLANGEKVDVPIKNQTESAKVWLDTVKSDKTININMNDNTVNVVQIMQDKLDTIQYGSTITPDGLIAPQTASNADLAIEAIIMKDK